MLKPVLLLLIALASPFAAAQVYQWVDDDGNVRFTDKPPPGHPDFVTPEAEEAGGAGQGSGSAASSSSRSSSTAAPDGKLFRVMLENLSYDISEENMAREIGRRYRTYSDSFSNGFNNANRATSPTHCRGSDYQLVTVDYAVGVLRSGMNAYKQAFHDLLKEQGYQVADSRESVFAAQRVEPPRMSIAGLIKGAFFEHCEADRSRQKAFNKTELTIEWQVFDNLEREVVFTTTTRGAESEWGEAVIKGELFSFESALLSAGEELLRNLEFKQAMVESAETETAVAVAPTNISYMIGDDSGTFFDRTDAIERGTVTIRTPGGHGSGFIVSDEGYVLTNEHVVGANETVIVVTKIGETYGQVVSKSAARDVAVVKIDDIFARDPLPLAATAAKIGQPLYVVGTPLDESLSFSVTRGIVSGLREMNGMPFYQTDAAVNPGNSGGPVLNEAGNVIAVSVSGIFTQSGGSLNTNFLIPIRDALDELGVPGRGL